MEYLRFPTACILLGLVFLAQPAQAADEEAAPPDAPPTPRALFSSDRVIVEWAPGAGRGDRVDARSKAEVEFERDLGDRRFQLVEVEPGQGAGDAIRELERDPAVLLAERDVYSAPHAIPNDPFFGHLWGLRNTGGGVAGFIGAVPGADIDASGAWTRTVGGPTTVIADIDSGYRFDSPDLGPVAWSNPADPPGGGDDDGNGITDDSHGADFVGTSANSPAVDGDPTDDNLIDGGHGVHTAGTIGAAGNDGGGITGVAQNARIMPLRVCSYFTDPTPTPVDDSGTRCPGSSQIQAINYAGSHGARVANMSLGGTSFSAAVRDAIATNPQTLFVISAGNDGEDNDLEPHYPCNYNPLAEGKSAVDNVICVAATNQADGLAGFSDWGATSVDLGAPGTETLSVYPATIETFSHDFEADDFEATWSKSSTNGFGRANPGDGPLTSFGMSDSPATAPTAIATYETTMTSGVAIPAGSGPCTLSGRRFRNGGTGGSFYYSVLSDGSPAFTNTGSTATGGSAMAPFSTAPIEGLGGHSVKLRFGFISGIAPTTANGIWLDDLEIACNAPLTTPPTYAFLQGTSMAAPHVTGAAALLFSLEPLATVTEAREALLSSVDPVASLAGKTTTGGRLDASAALDVFAPPPPEPPSDDPPPGGSPPPGGDDEVEGGGAPAGPDEVEPSAALLPRPVLSRCRVPQLAGRTPPRAKAALNAAGCRLGQIVRSKRLRGRGSRLLVVRRSTPGPGARPADGAVDIRLGPRSKRVRKSHR